ncbi:MAG: sigma-70 family RNA polymerase sigma factor [Acidobacteriia bacterium]|nr:sigma-70 family RNA polymerase sigma factor [Terriglobia bacterium]
MFAPVARERNLSWTELQQASDPDLVGRLMAGNHDAFAVIVDRYQRLVLSVALRIVKDEGEAEDVVQTVFLDIFNKLEQFDPARGTLKVWLLQYAYSRSINRRRYLEQRQFYSKLELSDVDPTLFMAGASRWNGCSAPDVARLVRQALGSLKAEQQIAIRLIYFEGLTLEEAAHRTGETVPAVRHHYYRGLTRLREVVNTPSSAERREIKAAETLGLEVPNLRPRPI